MKFPNKPEETGCGASIVENTSTFLANNQKFVGVQLLTQDRLYLAVDVKCRVCHLFDTVCQHLLLQNRKLFSLAQVVDGEYRFVDLAEKLCKCMVCKNWSKSSGNGLNRDGTPASIFYLRVHTYVDCVTYINCPVSLLHYYLQLKDNVLQQWDAVRVAEERCFEVAACAMQADFGDYDQYWPSEVIRKSVKKKDSGVSVDATHLGDQGTSSGTTVMSSECHVSFRADQYFPRWMIETRGAAFLTRHAPAVHADLRGLSRHDAQLRFCRDAVRLPHPADVHRYGLQRHRRDETNSVTMGVTWRGLHFFEKNSRCVELCQTFRWSHLGKVAFDHRKFTLLTVDGKRKCAFFARTGEKARYLLWFCRSVHQNLMHMQKELSEARLVERHESRQFRESYIYGDTKEYEWVRNHDGRSFDFNDYFQSSSLNLTSQSMVHAQRVSLVSNSSSNTTSGIVCDHRPNNHDDSENDDDIDFDESAAEMLCTEEGKSAVLSASTRPGLTSITVTFDDGSLAPAHFGAAASSDKTVKAVSDDSQSLSTVNTTAGQFDDVTDADSLTTTISTRKGSAALSDCQPESTNSPHYDHTIVSGSISNGLHPHYHFQKVDIAELRSRTLLASEFRKKSIDLPIGIAKKNLEPTLSTNGSTEELKLRPVGNSCGSYKPCYKSNRQSSIVLINGSDKDIAADEYDAAVLDNMTNDRKASLDEASLRNFTSNFQQVNRPNAIIESDLRAKSSSIHNGLNLPLNSTTQVIQSALSVNGQSSHCDNACPLPQQIDQSSLLAPPVPFRFSQSTTSLATGPSCVAPPPDYRQAVHQKYGGGGQFVTDSNGHSAINHAVPSGKRWPTISGIDQHDLPDCHPAVIRNDQLSAMTSQQVRQLMQQAQSEPRLGDVWRQHSAVQCQYSRDHNLFANNSMLPSTSYQQQDFADKMAQQPKPKKPAGTRQYYRESSPTVCRKRMNRNNRQPLARCDECGCDGYHLTPANFNQVVAMPGSSRWSQQDGLYTERRLTSSSNNDLGSRTCSATSCPRGALVNRVQSMQIGRSRSSASPSLHNARAGRPSFCATCQQKHRPSEPLDLTELRNLISSRGDMDLPMIRALCDDRSLQDVRCKATTSASADVLVGPPLDCSGEEGAREAQAASFAAGRPVSWHESNWNHDLQPPANSRRVRPATAQAAPNGLRAHFPPPYQLLDDSFAVDQSELTTTPTSLPTGQSTSSAPVVDWRFASTPNLPATAALSSDCRRRLPPPPPYSVVGDAVAPMFIGAKNTNGQMLYGECA